MAPSLGTVEEIQEADLNSWASLPQTPSVPFTSPLTISNISATVLQTWLSKSAPKCSKVRSWLGKRRLLPLLNLRFEPTTVSRIIFARRKQPADPQKPL